MCNRHKNIEKIEKGELNLNILKPNLTYSPTSRQQAERRERGWGGGRGVRRQIQGTDDGTGPDGKPAPAR
jgi:hypothetical protein